MGDQSDLAQPFDLVDGVAGPAHGAGTSGPAPMVVSAIEAQVQRTPGSVAVVHEGRHLTYAELNGRANRLARSLAERGAGRGKRVGVCLDRSLDMVAGLLAVLKTGSAYVPLDPAYPRDRLLYMAEDAGLGLILCDASGVPENLPAELSAPLDGLCGDGQEAPGDPKASIDADDIAYVIYTSGSTGRPKGVEVTHRGVANLLREMARTPRLTAEDVVLSVHSISFDPSVLDLFLPLTVGARIVLLPRSAATDGVELARRIASTGATLMDATPATWRLLLAAGWDGSPLLRIRSGGEAMTRDLADALLPRCAELWNAYGPTEATVCSSVHQVLAGTDTIPIGRALPGATLRVLNQSENGALVSVPQGSPGELFIGGAGLARGYLNRPDLTADRFLPDPFSADPGVRLYRTGDLVREGDDGVLSYLGRTDDQVKIRGYRIELGEVEGALLGLSQVANAAVVARPDASGEARLLAYVVPAPCDNPEELTAEALRRSLADRLPRWMIPSRFLALDRLPLSPSGKIDRRALPDPERARDLGTTAGHVTPRTELQRRLAAIWGEVLSRERVGLHDDFFDLGGHSLLVARLFGRIDREIGIELPLATIFDAPTLEALAARIAAAGPAGEGADPMIVRLKDGCSRQPLFLVIAMDEDAEIYLNLARHIGDGRAIYGVRIRAPQGGAAAIEGVPAMTARLLKRIRTIQPEGPYLIGGQCAGGVLAFEAALQLQRTGERLDLVILMESADAGAARLPRPPRRGDWRSTMRGLIIDGILGLTVALRSRGITPPRLLSARPSASDPDRLLRYVFGRYRPLGMLDAPVLLLRASAGDGRASDIPFREQYADPLFGWGRRVRGAIRAFDVPGGHGSMLEEPHARASADIVQCAVAEAVGPGELLAGTAQGNAASAGREQADRQSAGIGRALPVGMLATRPSARA